MLEDPPHGTSANAPASPRDLPLATPLIEAMLDLGYDALTPVQSRAIPLLVAGRDVVGRSPTGSGKTVAFAAPILAALDVGERALQALVLCPTRELATQVASEVRRLGRYLPGLTVQLLSGGRPIGPELGALGRGVHVVVATPGRALDHLRRGSLDLARVGTVVLDEADRMLDLGFLDDVATLLEASPKERRTAVFSATLPPAVEALCARFQRDAAQVTAEDEAPAIHHVAHVVDEPLAALRAVLAAHRPRAAIVFCNLKRDIASVAAHLGEAGHDVVALHGDLAPADRDRAMARFRNESARVLVASDLAARGLDVDAVDLVVNLEPPDRPDVYVHRAGRTARAGRSGVAVTLALRSEEARLTATERAAGLRLERLPCPVADAPPEPARFATLALSAGRKDKLRPGDILGALTGEAGLDADDVGRIEILDRVSFVAVARDAAGRAARKLSAGRVKGMRLKVDRVR